MKKIIRKTEAVMLMSYPKIEIEVRCFKRPEFQELIAAFRKDELDNILMARLTVISRDPEDIKLVCKEIHDMKKEITFVEDNLNSEDVLTMSDEEILRITMSTLEDDMVIIVDSQEEEQELIKRIKDRDKNIYRIKSAIYCCYTPYNEEVERKNNEKLEEIKAEIESEETSEFVGIFNENLPKDTKLENRPELMKLLDMAKNNMLDEIIIPKIGQLSRSVINVEDIFGRFRNEGVYMRCLREGIDNRMKMNAGILNYIRLLPKFEIEDDYLNEITMQ